MTSDNEREQFVYFYVHVKVRRRLMLGVAGVLLLENDRGDRICWDESSEIGQDIGDDEDVGMVGEEF